MLGLLLLGCTKQTLDKLQRVLNCSARVIFGGYSRQHVTPLLRDHLHWLWARERIPFKLCILVYTALHHVIWTRRALQCPLFPAFPLSVPLLVVIWSYLEQPGILCGWSGRLEHCTTGHSFGTYIINVQSDAQDTSVFSILLEWLFSWVRSSENCAAPL